MLLLGLVLRCRINAQYAKHINEVISSEVKYVQKQI